MNKIFEVKAERAPTARFVQGTFYLVPSARAFLAPKARISQSTLCLMHCTSCWLAPTDLEGTRYLLSDLLVPFGLVTYYLSPYAWYLVLDTLCQTFYTKCLLVVPVARYLPGTFCQVTSYQVPFACYFLPGT